MSAPTYQPAMSWLDDTGPSTIPARLVQLAGERANEVAIRRKYRGRWREWTWAEYAERVARVSAGLRTLGVGTGDRLAIQSENRPEWAIADLAAQGLGVQSMGVSPASPADETYYFLEHSSATVLVAEDEEQLDKVLTVRDRLPHLRHVIVLEPRGVDLSDDPSLVTFAQLEARGAATEDSVQRYAASVAALDPSTTAILAYTAGTTGPPKAAMISHSNLVAAARSAGEAWGTRPSDELLSHRPLCQLAERVQSVIGAVWTGLVVNFGEGGASFPVDVRDVQPTVFLSTPREWEGILSDVERRMAGASRLKRWVYRTCMRQGSRIAPRRMAGETTSVDRIVLTVCDLLVFRALREKLGLVRSRIAIGGAGPIAAPVLQRLCAMGILVRPGYGLTEHTALGTITPSDDMRIGDAGKAAPGVEIRIADDGEVLIRSAGVFQGYLNDEEATAAALDADGWLHTGDVGALDEDGFLRITGRKRIDDEIEAMWS